MQLVGFIIKKFVQSYYIFKHALRLSAFPSYFFQTYTPSAAKSILQNAVEVK
jgi:hypothetical protein